MDPEEFNRLLAGVREGNQSAKSEFVAAFRPLVSRLAGGALTGNPLQGPYDRSDIAQSVVFKALQIVQDGYPIHGPQAFHSLLRIMVTRKIIGLSRKPENRVPTAPLKDLDEYLTAISGAELSPSEVFGDAHDLETIRLLLRPENQEVFRLQCEGKTFAEIGAILGKKPHTVEVAYKRDLHRVSRLLDPEDPPEGPKGTSW